MKKRNVILLALLSLAAGVLASCDGDDGKTATATTNTTTTSQTTGTTTGSSKK
jgi:hypothetical protein